ncbi:MULTISPECIES: rod shape-determining protein MreC [unclassified Sphingomonas]|uniref:rod shape-determining protein MreC n=1 Tax=unclassified Sphingomonas TaxID=196159 RepID=UPI000E7186CB|nr:MULTISPECIES: rod shape-determining protein MreC [unclassified Sphingomonas]RKE49960.1 rod shape-determining protein MreC [Sphingomonas sp. PP-CC-1A-547]TCM08291.1 rod shape-determining protein MreC [Sphingomonas sp. PP-CC-3G-468]
MAPARDRRTGFSRRRQYGVFMGYVLAVAGAVVGLVLLVASTFNPPAFSALRMGVAGVTTPVSTGLATVGSSISGIPDAIGNYFFVKQENVALRADRERTRSLLMRARTIAYDNRRLRSLLAIRERSTVPVVTARLVSSSASSGRRYALLNAGRWNGVLPGMPVRGPDGLIGRVVETGPNAARILLLSDGDSIVPVRRTRDGMPAIAAGRGDGMIDIRSVNATNVRFNAGDLFVTTGTGGIYAPGVPVARVTKAGSDSVMARAFADPDTLDFALVERMFMPVPPPRPVAQQ